MADSNDIDFQMDKTSLYRDEVITDGRAGTIRKLTPLLPNGDVDTSRPTLFQGQTQVMTPAGALPLNFELDADNLEGAIDSFGEKAKVALEETMKELQEMRRQAASQIVVPGQDGPGGKIQL